MKEFLFGTKAETLHSLRSNLTLSSVPSFIYFSYEEWDQDSAGVLEQIQSTFSSQPVIIRSSAVAEDSSSNSLAGEFLSIDGIDPNSASQVQDAVQEVFASYGKGGVHLNHLNQVLVQEFITDCSMSGVLFTRDMTTGAPYYVINYDDESGKTDTISSGTGYCNRTLYIRHDALPKLRSPRFQALLAAVQEIEEISRYPYLDIEFVLSDRHEVYIVQVRRITTHSSWSPKISDRLKKALDQNKESLRELLDEFETVSDQSTIFGKMPDWNPAEMIGTSPKPLALSLYRTLITDRAWATARQQMGYATPVSSYLLNSFCGQPFINVGLSLQSLLPNSLPRGIAEKLIAHWLRRLQELPHLHDKIETEIAITCFTFDIDQQIDSLASGVLSPSERRLFVEQALEHTRSLVEGFIAPISDTILRLEELESVRLSVFNSKDRQLAKTLYELVQSCIELGTIPFAILARHGFIAQGLLRSLLHSEILSQSEIEILQKATKTIAGQFIEDMQRVANGDLTKSQFLETYGHLRPGTYDICSLRYDQDSGFLDRMPELHLADEAARFELSHAQEAAIAARLQDYGFSITPEELIKYIQDSIRGRELGKFLFTRTVSDLLEDFAKAAETRGLNREDVSFLEVSEVIDHLYSASENRLEDSAILYQLVQQRRSLHEITEAVQFPSLIFSESDLDVVPLMVGEPNFITRKTVTAACLPVDTRHLSSPEELDGKIVAIESADPGFDWIFSRPIVGLITKFGGANSHMAIRCAEFNLPAAIGCGEQIYERTIESRLPVILNCAERRLFPSH